MTPLFRKFLGLNWLLFINMIGLLIWGIWRIGGGRLRGMLEEG